MVAVDWNQDQKNSMENSKIEFTKDETRGYRLRAEMLVDLPIETVFSVFANPMQLERLTPPWLNFTVLTPQPIEIRQGLLLDYRLYLHHVPINWRTEIAVWEPPFRFVDQQLRGPYYRWYHEHTFIEIDGKTWVKDDVHYIPRGGRLVHHWLVRPDLENIFRFRHQALINIFREMKSSLAMSRE